MKDCEYTLSFNDAIDLVVNKGKWIQGEHFIDGLIMMCKGNFTLSGLHYLHTHSFEDGSKDAVYITTGLMSQKFRVVSTQCDAMRNL